MKNEIATEHSQSPTDSNSHQPRLKRGESTTVSSTRTVPTNNIRQARYWIATIPEDAWKPCLPNGAQHAKGQLECGESGYRHWQFVFSFSSKKTLSQVRDLFGLRIGHFEPTRSKHADAYVWKDSTRIGE